MIIPETYRSLAVKLGLAWLNDVRTEILAVGEYGVALRHSDGSKLTVTRDCIEFEPVSGITNHDGATTTQTIQAKTST